MSSSDDLKKMHFLVVDDYESMRTMMTTQLKNLGITKITTAPSGNAALKVIVDSQTSNPVNYVLSDLMMEDGNGIELASAIRQKLKLKIPITMITSKSEVSYVLDAVRAGVTNYLVKPWDEAEFIKKITEGSSK